MKICVLHSKYKVFWGSRGAKRSRWANRLGSILGPFSIKNLIKNRCRNRCRKSYEFWCQNGQKWCQHGSKNHDFLSLFAKRWLYENVSFTKEIQGFLRYRPSKIHQQFIQEPSKIHQRFMLEQVMQKWWKNGPKWSQHGVQNRFKIHPTINQKQTWNITNAYLNHT